MTVQDVIQRALAAYDVGDHISVPIGAVSLAVKVNQKIGDCYNVTISYSRF